MTRPRLLHMTLGIRWRTRTPRCIQTGLSDWWYWDAPIPGIEPWNEILLDPRVWHFNFHGPDAERLVAVVSASTSIAYGMISPAIPPSPMRPPELFAATYAQPGGDAGWVRSVHRFFSGREGQQIFEQVKLTMPVLAVGRREVVWSTASGDQRHVATNVREVIVAGSGHWLMEERPAEPWR